MGLHVGFEEVKALVFGVEPLRLQVSGLHMVVSQDLGSLLRGPFRIRIFWVFEGCKTCNRNNPTFPKIGGPRYRSQHTIILIIETSSLGKDPYRLAS